MALIVMEGFDYQANPGDGADIVASGAYYNWTALAGLKVAGQLGGSAYSNNTSTANFMQYLNPGAAAVTTYFGDRVQMIANSSSIIIFTMLDSAGAAQIGVAINASNKLIVFRGTTANVLATGTTTMINNSYYYLELKSTINAATGAFELRINGVTEASGSSANTQATGNANVAGFKVSGPTAVSMNHDDIYFLDSSGGSPLNNFLCDSVNALRIETLFPTSNDVVAFTPNTSTNVSQIQETGSDNDTTFNSASGAAVDTFNHGSLSSTPVTIFACSVIAKCRSDDVSNMTYRTKLKSGATTSNGTTFLAPTVYQYVEDLYVTDPNTGVAWTATNVNATKIGYERVT